MKLANELTISKHAKQARLKKLHHEGIALVTSCEVPQTSIEQLPNELIQQIFFACLEVNLPRASTRLAQALSTDSTYSALILIAYFDDDGKHPVETRHFLPAFYRAINVQEKVGLQRAILSCRWCTSERIKACLPALSRLAMVQAWYTEYERECEERSETNVDDEVIIFVPIEAIQNIAKLPKLDDHVGMEDHYFARSYLRSSTEIAPCTTYLPRIMTWSAAVGADSTNGKVHLHKTGDDWSSTLAVRVLPDWLVGGSEWTSDALDFLQLLRQGLKSIRHDFILEISANAVFQGMSSAIRGQHVEALMTLLEFHNDVFAKHQSEDTSLLSPPTYHPLPTYLFHLATKARQKSSDFIWLLVRGGVDSIPKDDNVLTAWALHGQAEGDPVAKWLLHHMSGTVDYGIGRRGYLFVQGRLSWRVPDDDFPCARYSFAEELSYPREGNQSKFTNLEGEPCG